MVVPMLVTSDHLILISRTTGVQVGSVVTNKTLCTMHGHRISCHNNNYFPQQQQQGLYINWLMFSCCVPLEVVDPEVSSGRSTVLVYKRWEEKHNFYCDTHFDMEHEGHCYWMKQRHSAVRRKVWSATQSLGQLHL